MWPKSTIKSDAKLPYCIFVLCLLIFVVLQNEILLSFCGKPQTVEALCKFKPNTKNDLWTVKSSAAIYRAGLALFHSLTNLLTQADLRVLGSVSFSTHFLHGSHSTRSIWCPQIPRTCSLSPHIALMCHQRHAC